MPDEPGKIHESEAEHWDRVALESEESLIMTPDVLVVNDPYYSRAIFSALDAPLRWIPWLRPLSYWVLIECESQLPPLPGEG